MTKLIFGIDLGIASCGWAALRVPENDDDSGEIVSIGSWLFDAPEIAKDRKLKNQERREHRLHRRVVRRRAQRMSEIRRLFRSIGLLTTDHRDALQIKGADPWEARAAGLDRRLDNVELAVALGHIAKHRGYQSSAKDRGTNAAKDDQKMLRGIEVVKEKLASYRTLGEGFARDQEFSKRRRNRGGTFDRIQTREDLKYEVEEIFKAQRKFKNNYATHEIEKNFIEIAFRQLPFQDSESLVGFCKFEPTEKRASKHAPSFEKFRLLSRLATLRISDGFTEREISTEERRAVAITIGKWDGMTVKQVRKTIGLADEEYFTTIPRQKENDIDIVAKGGKSTFGSKRIRLALGEDRWKEFEKKAEILDQIAYCLSFFETNEKIIKELSNLNIDCETLDVLKVALEDGAFASFSGASHISAKAARKLIPLLEQGKSYDQACDAVGYDHSASRLSPKSQVNDKKSFNSLVNETTSQIANPVAQKALTEALKQLWAMRNRWGLPDAIHIELSRDVGNSLEKRKEIENRIKDTTNERNRQRKAASELLQTDNVSGNTLLRYRLCLEQAWRCPYTDRCIPPNAIGADNVDYQVDHILPWSRFGDDSFANKVLCCADANQAKAGRTPYEWICAEKGDEPWRQFATRVEATESLLGRKKRNLLLRNAAEAEGKFRSRNLNDTRYAARLLADAAKFFFPAGDRGEKGGVRRVFTRPGALTSALRHAWGVESLKKTEDNTRIRDDRHHALDALVVAAVDERQIQRLTRSYQEWEQRGLARPLREVPPPWGDLASFRREVVAAYEAAGIARPERRRARGSGHDATIRRLRKRDGVDEVFERKSIHELELKDLERAKNPERNAALIQTIRNWIESGKPKDKIPLATPGSPVRKLRLHATAKPSVIVRGGSADRGDIVRVDVFSKPTKAGKINYFLVPIYAHQIFDKKDWKTPPNKAIAAHKNENNWIEIDSFFSFRFSLYYNSFVFLKSKKEQIEGYFQGVDRSTGKITVGGRSDSPEQRSGIGSRTLLEFRKFSVDRFGRRFPVRSEVRTWHGVACTSRNPPD